MSKPDQFFFYILVNILDKIFLNKSEFTAKTNKLYTGTKTFLFAYFSLILIRAGQLLVLLLRRSQGKDCKTPGTLPSCPPVSPMML